MGWGHGRAIALALVVWLAAAWAPSAAGAQVPDAQAPDAQAPDVHPDNRPTSGDMSLVSGRTLGNGQTALSGGLGWPGIWAQLTLAPSSKLNLGVRGSVLYGSPVMGLSGGVGGSIAIPIRIHFFGSGTVDMAVLLEPSFVLGEGALVGQTGTFGNDLGLGGMGDGGILVGVQLSEAVTFGAGLLAEIAFVTVPDASDAHLVGGFLAMLSLEVLFSRDTMIFAEVRGGLGLAPERLFVGPEILRVSLGLAYLM